MLKLCPRVPSSDLIADSAIKNMTAKMVCLREVSTADMRFMLIILEKTQSQVSHGCDWQIALISKSISSQTVLTLELDTQVARMNRFAPLGRMMRQ